MRERGPEIRGQRRQSGGGVRVEDFDGYVRASRKTSVMNLHVHPIGLSALRVAMLELVFKREIVHRGHRYLVRRRRTFERVHVNVGGLPPPQLITESYVLGGVFKRRR